jgi:transcriptional antiterminator NusG
MWYVLQCQSGKEETVLRACRKAVSPEAIEDAFLFRCERLWRSDGAWKPVIRTMFPGYVFLESSRPELLSAELERYAGVNLFRPMEEPGYLIPVYEEEEERLRELCGKRRILQISYGYRDRESGRDRFVHGPLKDWAGQIQTIDWHRRFARLEIPLARRRAVIWAGIEAQKFI